MSKRHYPITEEYFYKSINPLILSYYSRAGRPQTASNYQVFCATLYVLRTGISWRDLPECFGYWPHLTATLTLPQYSGGHQLVVIISHTADPHSNIPGVSQTTLSS